MKNDKLKPTEVSEDNLKDVTGGGDIVKHNLDAINELNNLNKHDSETNRVMPILFASSQNDTSEIGGIGGRNEKDIGNCYNAGDVTKPDN